MLDMSYFIRTKIASDMSKAAEYDQQQVIDEDGKDRELQSLRELLRLERRARMRAENENAAQVREIEILKKRIGLEDSLWKSDTAKRRLEPGADIHAIHSRGDCSIFS